ncbi:MAG: hypothetical protein IJM42_08060 [Synergistes sp.]|uniref:RipA family octameric membrane protein n=1 Tax=Merdimmobilis hominis TaxID=2897707 RepID=UPI0032D3B741|nr:hypothetical protein [Clostridia bacterium]MBQ9882545.1 hypothetical protein [Synergistes sp.]
MAKISEEEKSALLSQWQTCVEMANSISERRDNMNNLFVTLNLAIIAAISFMWDTKTIALLVAGVVLCVVWMLFIKNFRELNKAKFDVINQMEKHLPAQPFIDEWEELKKSKKYIEGTKLERCFPIAFCLLYIAIFAIIMISAGQGGQAV